MGTTLTGTTPQDTYDSLIKVTDNGPLSGSLKVLTDGLGNDSTLSLSTTAASIAGTLAVSGDFSIADKIVHIGDTNTAIRFPAADTITFETSGAEAARITSAGNVGIGTSAPTEKLSVAGAIITTGGITGHGANRVSISQEGANGGFIQSYGANASTVGGFTFRQASSDFSITQIPLSITTSGVLDILSGIKFPATQVASADANTLDDYEEGTWTPASTSSGYTISSSSGLYTKIGRQVTIRATVNFSAVNAASNSEVNITGSPFTPSVPFTGLCRDNTTTGAVYVASISTGNVVIINSMDGVASSSQRTIRVSEDYIFTITYFV